MKIRGQLEGLAAVIGEMGYQPIPTSDPEEALRLVKRGRCRLLLADFHMPGMRQYEFLDQVLRCDPGVHVIVMTREYTLETALEAIRRGADGAAAASVAGERARAGKRDIQRVHYRDRGLHRSDGPAGTSIAAKPGICGGG
jgi:DNA-binding NtrC family response regulator